MSGECGTRLGSSGRLSPVHGIALISGHQLAIATAYAVLLVDLP